VRSTRTLKKPSKKVAACRRNVLRLAHRSEFGWSTVKEYLSDELASNSEDEKSIFRSKRRRSKQASSRRRSRAASGVGRRLNLRGFSSRRLSLDFLARLVLCMQASRGVGSVLAIS